MRLRLAASIARIAAIALALSVASGKLYASPAPVPHAPAAWRIASPRSDSDEIALGAALLAQFDADRGVVASPQSRRI